MKDVAVIGGGIIGLASAYFLQKAGYKVTVFDMGDMESGCSYGNAGMIVPSHLVPFAAPGMISKGIRWMFNSSSPFYIKPRMDWDLLRWGYHFYRSATHEHVERGATALKELSVFSQAVYESLADELPADFGYQRRGLLMLYKTADTEREEKETAALANRHGIEARILSPTEIKSVEPEVAIDVRGGVYFPGDSHLTPQLLMAALKTYLKNHAVGFNSQAEVIGFVKERDTVEHMKTPAGEFSFDQYVVAAGSWSPLIVRMLGLSIPVQAGKGYSITCETPHRLQIPSILLEARVAVTPMGQTIRFGGTMELSGVDHTINMNRVRGIVNSVSQYYPDMNFAIPAVEEIWHGLRPCTPDGLPCIGRPEKLKNVVIATGHGMMGVSLAPGTGKLVAEIIGGDGPSVPIGVFKPDRF